MSKDMTYPFESQLHIVGKFAGLKLPMDPHMTNALSTGRSTMVPQKVDVNGNLHMGVFAFPSVKPVTDLVFRIDADARTTDEISKKLLAFIKKLVPVITPDQHLAVRRVSNKNITFVIIRFYFTNDFSCTEHPEMKLGEQSVPYYCPVCGSMQIAGLPHIEDVSE